MLAYIAVLVIGALFIYKLYKVVTKYERMRTAVDSSKPDIVPHVIWTRPAEQNEKQKGARETVNIGTGITIRISKMRETNAIFITSLALLALTVYFVCAFIQEELSGIHVFHWNEPWKKKKWTKKRTKVKPLYVIVSTLIATIAPVGHGINSLIHRMQKGNHPGSAVIWTP